MIIPLGARSTRTPTNVDSYWDNVVLLVKFTEAANETDFADLSTNTKTRYNKYGCRISTAQKKFGTGSLISQVSTCYYNWNSDDDWKFGTGDFCIEAWVRPKNGTGLHHYLNFAAGSTITLSCYDNNFRAYCGTGNFTDYAFTEDQWYHIAVTREGTTARFFVGGTMSGSRTVSTNFSTTYTPGFSGRINSFMDSVRVTKGVARYTADFAVPTEDFPETGA
jgi:hypothetical protein